MNDEIVIGRKRIMAFFRLKSWRTVQNWKAKKRIILRHMPNGKPFIICFEAVEFLIAYDDILKGREKGGK